MHKVQKKPAIMEETFDFNKGNAFLLNNGGNYTINLFLAPTSNAAELKCGNRYFNSLVPDYWTCCAGKLYPKKKGIFFVYH